MKTELVAGIEDDFFLAATHCDRLIAISNSVSPAEGRGLLPTLRELSDSMIFAADGLRKLSSTTRQVEKVPGFDKIFVLLVLFAAIADDLADSIERMRGAVMEQIEAVSDDPHRPATLDEVMAHLAETRDEVQPVLDYLRDK